MSEIIIPFLMLILATVLLSVNFVLTKLFQAKEGSSLSMSMLFLSINGFASAIFFLIANGFKVSITPFALAMALIQGASVVSYTLLGFKIMSKENVSDYTFFLMTGGMIVPYVWGVVFLKERLTAFNFIGLVLITVAIFLINGNSKKTLKIKIMCGAIFLLNGMTSVSAKLHQISKVGISSGEFVVLTSVIKGVLCLTVFLICFKKAQKTSIKMPSALIAVAASIVGGVSYFLQLNGAATLPATICYPVISGGAIVFTGIAGLICFKEKITKKSALGMLICLVGTCFFL